jgi:signal transduction histidine kinase
LRFDDMIATVLERSSDRADQRVAQWRQLVDLLAQRHHGDSPQCRAAYEFLRVHRTEVPLAVREAAAASLRGLQTSPELVRFFSEDHPTVAAALLRGVRLSGREWTALLASLSPTGRAILRHRRDLPDEVGQALAGFGASDFVLERETTAGMAAPVQQQPAAAPPPPPSPEAGGGRSQIWELVERIEAFQRARDAEAREEASAAPAEAFRWETGPDGVILWVEGAPRGSLVGQSIAAIAALGQHGVDGQAAGAFHKRAPFREARFSVAGQGPASGDWRISGVPFFDPHRGNFLGYRGSARRPRLDEVAAPPPVEPVAGVLGTQLPPDSLRQLVHELRTPLNAIIGFAEMIEGQYLGPAGAQYRSRAQEIAGQGQRLLAAIDDLDVAARSDTQLPSAASASCDAGAMLTRLRDRYEAEGRPAGFEIRLEAPVPLAGAEPSAVERMLARMLAATIGLAEAGESMAATMSAGTAAGRPAVIVAIDRPRAIRDLEENALLHPGYSPEGDWPAAPALGLGFSLRLVRKLAEAVGGALDISERQFTLTIPAAPEAADAVAGEDEESA